VIVFWFALIIGIMALSAWLLHKYVEHREFIGQEQGMAVGRAIGKLSDEELWAIITGCPMPEPVAKSKRWWRR
jgi:hypothetical protein